MASASTRAATTKSILKPVTTLKGHRRIIESISYFPDGQRMISGSLDKTTRQWDLDAGKEIEGARNVCEKEVYAVAVSSDDRWVVTSGGDGNCGELKASEVETGIVKTFKGHASAIICIDISADSILLASGSQDKTARIWNLEMGKLVAGPFKSNMGRVSAVQFSKDSKKLAVKSDLGTCLEVWDIQSQKLDVRIGKPGHRGTIISPVFWTNKNRNIISAFQFNSDSDQYDTAKTIYEFDGSTLETVGVPFEGHTELVTGLALSFDGALLASASCQDNTVKLWAFESRQLLASFDIQQPCHLILSSDSRQLIYTTHPKDEDDYKICICDTPPDILAQARIIARKKSAHMDILNSDATRRPAGHRRPPIFATPYSVETSTYKKPTFLRISELLRFSSHANAVHPVRNNQPRDPLDFPATSPLPRNRPLAESSSSTSLPGGRAFFNPNQSSSDKGKRKAREPKRKTARAVNVPLGQATYGDVVGVDDGVRPFVLFFCLSWFQKKEKKPKPRPVYDDDPESEEEEANVLDLVPVHPSGVQHGEIELNQVANQSQPEAGPSCLAVTSHLKA